MANGQGNVNSWSYKVADASKVVALLVVVGGFVADHYITQSDLERANERVSANAANIGKLSDTLYSHRLKDASDSATIRENTRRIAKIERRRGN